MIKSCIRICHPTYNFKKNTGLVVVKKSLETSIGLRLGVYSVQEKESTDGPLDAKDEENQPLK